MVRVGDQEITRAQFDRALQARLTGTSPLSPTGPGAVVLDPPDYRRCIAAVRAQLRTAGGSSAPSRKTLKANCAAQYDQARTQVISTLIQQAWVAQQAKDAGVHAPAGSVASTLTALQKQPGFQRRLKRSGLTLQDVRATVTTQLLNGALVQKTASAKPPTKAQARQFLEDHPEFFGTRAAEDRRRRVSQCRGREAAKAALRKGKAVENVIAGLGVQKGMRQGGFTVTDGDGQLSPAVQQAVAEARRGAVVGPVKVGEFYYVVRVRSASKAKVPAFSKVEPKVRQLYLTYQAQNAQNTVQQKLAETWRPKTFCARATPSRSAPTAPRRGPRPTRGSVRRGRAQPKLEIFQTPLAPVSLASVKVVVRSGLPDPPSETTTALAVSPVTVTDLTVIPEVSTSDRLSSRMSLQALPPLETLAESVLVRISLQTFLPSALETALCRSSTTCATSFLTPVKSSAEDFEED